MRKTILLTGKAILLCYFATAQANSTENDKKLESQVRLMFITNMILLKSDKILLPALRKHRINFP